jgi:hypothetical protein
MAAFHLLPVMVPLESGPAGPAPAGPAACAGTEPMRAGPSRTTAHSFAGNACI